jgi:hypothetical protein
MPAFTRQAAAVDMAKRRGIFISMTGAFFVSRRSHPNAQTLPILADAPRRPARAVGAWDRHWETTKEGTLVMIRASDLTDKDAAAIRQAQLADMPVAEIAAYLRSKGYTVSARPFGARLLAPMADEDVEENVILSFSPKREFDVEIIPFDGSDRRE